LFAKLNFSKKRGSSTAASSCTIRDRIPAQFALRKSGRARSHALTRRGGRLTGPCFVPRCVHRFQIRPTWPDRKPRWPRSASTDKSSSMKGLEKFGFRRGGGKKKFPLYGRASCRCPSVRQCAAPGPTGGPPVTLTTSAGNSTRQSIAPGAHGRYTNKLAAILDGAKITGARPCRR